MDTTTDTTTKSYGGRDFDTRTTLRQIGMGNVLAISGGRRTGIYDDDARLIGLRLPVHQGYRVDVLLADDDTYTVRRVFARGGKVWVKGEATDVYADQLGDVAYRASCYLDEFAA